MLDKTSVDWTSKLEEAFKTVAEYLERDNDLSKSDKINMENTPKRVAKAFMEMTSTKTNIVNVLEEIIATGFPREAATTESMGLITQGPIEIVSICPHHWLTVEYEAYISYIPEANGTVIGLSKIARLAQILGKRPVLQEQLTSDIADVLHFTKGFGEPYWPNIQSLGSAVMLIGKHSCMSCRGVKSNALTTTAELRGRFRKGSMEQRFYQYIDACRSAKLR